MLRQAQHDNDCYIVTLIHCYIMKYVGIIGAGTMGIGIAQIAATNGCKVWVYDANAKQVETATVGLEKP